MTRQDTNDAYNDFLKQMELLKHLQREGNSIQIAIQEIKVDIAIQELGMAKHREMMAALFQIISNQPVVQGQ